MASPNSRSFTVRIPLNLYLEVAKVAEADGQCLNVTVNKLLKRGLGEQMRLDEALRRLLFRMVDEEMA